jgi:hypothetical protein
MSLVNMKVTDDNNYPEASPNPYGYGLSINLSDDQCEALGIKTPLAAGSVVSVQAIAVVVSATQSVDVDGDSDGPDVRMSLQITDMEIKGAGQPTQAETASLLYGS